MAKLNPDERMSALSEIGDGYAEIQAAKAAVHDLEVALAAKIKPFVASEGPGAHAMPLPGGKKLIVTFRKSKDVYEIGALDPATIPGLMPETGGNSTS